MRGEGVCAVVWSLDGRWVVSGGGDGVVKVWARDTVALGQREGGGVGQGGRRGSKELEGGGREERGVQAGGGGGGAGGNTPTPEREGKEEEGGEGWRF